MLCEMQPASTKIWTRVPVSISYSDNHYTTGTSMNWINLTAQKQMNSNSFKTYITDKLFPQKSYIYNMYVYRGSDIK